MSSRAAVTGFKKCSRFPIDKSVYDFVHHADSCLYMLSPVEIFSNLNSKYLAVVTLFGVSSCNV